MSRCQLTIIWYYILWFRLYEIIKIIVNYMIETCILSPIDKYIVCLILFLLNDCQIVIDDRMHDRMKFGIGKIFTVNFVFICIHITIVISWKDLMSSQDKNKFQYSFLFWAPKDKNIYYIYKNKNMIWRDKQFRNVLRRPIFV